MKFLFTYFKNNHIFYPYLRKMKLEKKKYIFDTFQNSLKNINISKLNGYAEQLEQANYTLNNFELLKEYLLFAEREHQKFINSLISGLHD